jgi:glutaconate CoA-transferase subunit A
MSNEILLPDVDSLAARVADGAKVAVFKDGAVPMDLGRALVRKGVRDLHIVTVPTSGLLADMLIGAGCVATVETSGVTLGEYGQAPCFGRAVKGSTIRIMDATCPAVYTGLQAAEKGVPFIPMRGLIGSDILANRADFKTIDNPYESDDPIVAIPAIRPDVSLIHAPMADSYGNVWIGRQAELKIMAHASAESLVTCERLYDGNLLEDPQLAPAVIPAMYVGGVAVAEKGGWPLGLIGEYDDDADAVLAYVQAAATPEGFQDWLAAAVHGRQAAAE